MSLDDSSMSLIGHLTDLRYRLVKTFQGIFLGACVGLYFSSHILEFMIRPVLPHLGEQPKLVFTSPMGDFMVHLKVGLIAGILLSCPYWLYHVWKFIAPGLYSKERKFAAAFISSGTLLFLGGASFAYWMVFPAAFQYLFSFGTNSIQPMITIDDYLSFFTLTVLAFGLAFEMPLILVILAVMGVVDAGFLRKHRRFAIVGMALIAAVMSPPDAISMMMLWVPLVLLYEASILIIQFFVSKARSNLPVPTSSI